MIVGVNSIFKLDYISAMVFPFIPAVAPCCGYDQVPEEATGRRTIVSAHFSVGSVYMN